jgi:hypothetical protein
MVERKKEIRHRAPWCSHIYGGQIVMHFTTTSDVVVQGRKKKEFPSFFIVFFCHRHWLMDSTCNKVEEEEKNK